MLSLSSGQGRGLSVSQTCDGTKTPSGPHTLTPAACRSPGMASGHPKTTDLLHFLLQAWETAALGCGLSAL